MALFEKLQNKRKEKLKQYELLSTGIYIGELHYTKTNKQSRVFLCFVRALLLFLGAVGSVGATVSAFGLPYSVPAFLAAVLVISVLIAFIYYNRITFYIGYILFFISFAVSITSLYWYVNSGYQAFMNEFYQKYSNYFHLSSARESTEFIEDRSLTVTIAMIFVATFICLLLNIAISGYMSIIETFLITFPLVQLALYIDAKPSILYVAMLLATYITVAILGRSSHFKIPDFRKRNMDFMEYKNSKYKKIYTYTADGTSQITITGLAVIFSVIFLLATSLIFYSNYSSTGTTSKLKNTTDEYVKMVVQNGIYSLFDRYSATGGLAEGKLGGVGSVRPDYQPDYSVSFVPVNMNPVYLKGYEGIVYHDNQFYDRDSSYYRAYYDWPIPVSKLKNGKSYVYSLADHAPSKGANAVMNISSLMTFEEIVQSSSTLDYKLLPYYTTEMPVPITNENVSDNAAISDAALVSGRAYTAIYEPYVMSPHYNCDILPDKEMEEDAYNYYLEVPQELKDVLDEFIDEADVRSLAKEYNSASDYAEKYKIRYEIFRRIKSKFYDEYPYTMAPGTTPRGNDFVRYFLSEQKRGYCAHFAASSTLILRRLGIPAKYVEGYMISPSDYDTADIKLPDNIADWISPDYPNYLEEPFLVTIEVTDGAAHAWSEVYMDGYGWMPYDFTPPSSEDTVITNFNLASLLGGLLITTSNNTSPDAPGGTNNVAANNPDLHFNFNFNSTFGFIVMPLICIILFTILVIFATSKYEYTINALRTRKALNAGDISTAMALTYISFAHKIRRSLRRKLPANLSPNELCTILCETVDSLAARKKSKEKSKEKSKDKSKEKSKEELEDKSNEKSNDELKNITGINAKDSADSNAEIETKNDLITKEYEELKKEIQTLTGTANQSLYGKTTFSAEDYKLFTQQCRNIIKHLRFTP